MSFDWPDDIVFNKWMDDFPHSKKIEIAKDDVVQDEDQTYDTLVHAEEDKEEQLAQVQSTVVPTNDVVEENPDINFFFNST